MPRNPEDYVLVMANLVKDGDALVLTPCDEQGSTLLQQILDAAPGALHWHSRGKQYGADMDRLNGVRLACGGTYDIDVNDYAGAITIYLDLTASDDVDALRILAQYCWATGIAVDPSSTADRLLLFAAAKCKVCNGTLGHDTKAKDWRTCNDCAARCGHEYVMGVGVYNGGLAYMSYCSICGRADPAWRPSEEPAEDLVDIVAMGGVRALIMRHSDGSSTTVTKK